MAPMQALPVASPHSLLCSHGSSDREIQCDPIAPLRLSTWLCAAWVQAALLRLRPWRPPLFASVLHATFFGKLFFSAFWASPTVFKVIFISDASNGKLSSRSTASCAGKAFSFSCALIVSRQLWHHAVTTPRFSSQSACAEASIPSLPSALASTLVTDASAVDRGPKAFAAMPATFALCAMRFRNSCRSFFSDWLPDASSLEEAATGTSRSSCCFFFPARFLEAAFSCSSIFSWIDSNVSFHVSFVIGTLYTQVS